MTSDWKRFVAAGAAMAAIAALTGGCPQTTESGDSALSTPGPAGPQGPTGPQGTQGPAGSQGPQGEQGDTGATGANGLPGQPGPQGLRGVTGANGADGADGATGPEGPAGQDGADGDTGPAGPPGPSDLLFWGRFDGVQTEIGDAFRALEVGGSAAIESLSRQDAGDYLVVLNVPQSDAGTLGISVTTSAAVPANSLGAFANVVHVTDHPSGNVAINILAWYMTAEPPLNLITATRGDVDFTLTVLNAAAP